MKPGAYMRWWDERGGWEPLLSICIPTYRRAELLRTTLESVLQSARGHEGWIEIVISDNASPDHTRQVAEEFAGRWTGLRYHRNETNIGAERNFYRAVELTRSQYVWILGDDDLIATQFFEQLQPRLSEKPDLVICNHSIYNRDFSYLHRRSFLPANAVSRFDDRDDIMATFGASLGFISALVFRRQDFFNVPRADYEHFANVGFSFLFTIYAMLGQPCHVAYIAEPLILNRGGNSPMPDWERSFVDGIALVFAELARRGYSARALVRAKTLALRNYVLKYALNARIAAPPATVLAVRLRHYYADCSYYWLVIRPLWLVPPVVLRVMRGSSRKARQLWRRAPITAKALPS